MMLSIVTTMYRSQEYLEEFYSRVLSAIHEIGVDYEFVFVNDGSPDDSAPIILELQKSDPRVILLDLSRNFGHHKAIMAGLREASGELIFLIDCDLEEDPRWLIPFYEQLHARQADVIYGVQEKRKGDFAERFFGSMFYEVFNYLSEQPIPKNVTMARLMTSNYVRNLVQHDEKEFFLGATFASVGFHQEPLTVQKDDKGASSYSVRRKVALMVNAITSSSNKPLIYIFYLGAAMSLISFLVIVCLIIRHFFIEKMLAGWPSLVVSIYFTGGLIILSLGIVGIYLSKIYSETKNRPTVIVRKKYVSK
jgi:putative glycosyltransferase